MTAVGAVAQAAPTLLSLAAPAAQKVEGQEDGLHLWRAGFGLTYNAELRAERKERAGSIVDADVQRYRRFTGHALAAAGLEPQIGRAFCGERVCTYVKISVCEV